MKVASIVGARPQFVKAAAVSRALAARSGVTHLLIHTGQHYDDNLSSVFFRELEIPAPDLNLGIGSGTHGVQTGRMLEAAEKALTDLAPDRVLVYGDTNSTLAGALAAVKLHLRVGHVEAGLRSFNRRMPEEINRIVADSVSDLLFAPTATAEENLRKEGVPAERIRRVGDVMYDVALFAGGKADRSGRILERMKLEAKSYLLATLHRAENTDDPARLGRVVEGLRKVSSDLPVVFPLHPRTRAALQREGLLEDASRDLRVIDPVGYLEMTQLERNAKMIATDSGGVQKEAFFHRVPCATLRDETEWVETVECGANRLVGSDPDRLAAAVRDGVKGNGFPEDAAAFYGEGRAAERIAEAIADA